MILSHSYSSLLFHRKRLTVIGQLRLQSPYNHQGLMKQIALEALTALQCAVKRGDMGGVKGAGGLYMKWLDSLQSAVRNGEEIFNQLVSRWQKGSIAPARHKAGQRQRSQMLSPSLWWHANFLHHQGQVIVPFVCTWIKPSASTCW